MQNWQNLLSTPFSRLSRMRAGHATSMEELRQRHLAISAEFVAGPADVASEPAQLGQLKGEWIRPSGEAPQRLLLYFHGGGYISGSPASHRALIARLCRAAGAAALSLEYRLAPEFPFPA